MGRRYANPPVVEALCEVLTTRSQWDATIPGLFYERVKDRFPKRGQRADLGIEVTLGPETPDARVTQREPRSQFSRDDGSRMVQVGRDLVVVNQLRPYPQFEEWRPEVLRALDVYRELAKPAGVDRLGLRYINRVVVPETQFPMDRYFRIHPQVPRELSASHGPFMLRLDLPASSGEHRLLITFGSAPSDAGTTAFILDLYDMVGIGPKEGFASLERRIDEAHANVEKAFEGAITDSARALFEGDALGRGRSA